MESVLCMLLCATVHQVQMRVGPAGVGGKFTLRTSSVKRVRSVSDCLCADADIGKNQVEGRPSRSWGQAHYQERQCQGFVCLGVDVLRQNLRQTIGVVQKWGQLLPGSCSCLNGGVDCL